MAVTLATAPVSPASALGAPSVATASVQRASRTRQKARPQKRATPVRTPSRVTKRPVRTAASTPALRYGSPRGAAALTSNLGALLNGKTKTGTWGAMVVSLTRGDTLFAQNADGHMVPASTMKLFTTAIALDRLGPDHSFSTDVLRDGPLEAGGTVRGNLILRGDGDPSMSPRLMRGGPDAAMNMLAQLTVGAGIKHVTGDLIADASAFESRRIPDGWLNRYAGAGYAAPFSALSLNENIVIVGVSPNEGSGGATVFLEPATRGISVSSTVRTVAGSGASLSIRRLGDDKVLVTGTIGARAGARRYQLVVGDPPTFTAGADGQRSTHPQWLTIRGRRNRER